MEAANFRSSAGKILLFLALTTALTASVDIPDIRGVQPPFGGERFYTFLAMWAPGTAALLTLLFTRSNLREIGWRWPEGRYTVIACLVPAAYAAVVYIPTWIAGGVFDPSGWQEGSLSIPASLLSLFTVHFLSGFLFATGEEIGWRGLLVPQLAQRMSFKATALVSGVIWSLWHWDVIIWGTYSSGTPILFSLACFTVMTVALSFVLAWLRLASGSVWPCAVFHGAHNVIIQEFFDRATLQESWVPYVTTEFGLGLAVSATVTAVVFMRRARRFGGSELI